MSQQYVPVVGHVAMQSAFVKQLGVHTRRPASAGAGPVPGQLELAVTKHERVLRSQQYVRAPGQADAHSASVAQLAVQVAVAPSLREPLEESAAPDDASVNEPALESRGVPGDEASTAESTAEIGTHTPCRHVTVTPSEAA